MNKILFPVLFAVCTASVFAQATVATATDAKADAATSAQTAAEKSADAFCLRETGSHLRAIRHDHAESAVECANSPGRTYSREDIQRTGATSTADALRRLDPSIH